MRNPGVNRQRLSRAQNAFKTRHAAADLTLEYFDSFLLILVDQAVA